MERQTGTDLAPKEGPPSLFPLFFRACVRVTENKGKGRSHWCLGRTKPQSLLGTKKTGPWLFPGCLANQGGAGSRTVAVFWLQVFTWLRKAAMDPLENNHRVTRNQGTVGLSIHSTSDTLVVTSYLLLVLFFGLWV